MNVANSWHGCARISCRSKADALKPILLQERQWVRIIAIVDNWYGRERTHLFTCRDWTQLCKSELRGDLARALTVARVLIPSTTSADVVIGDMEAEGVFGQASWDLCRVAYAWRRNEGFALIAAIFMVSQPKSMIGTSCHCEERAADATSS